MFSIALCDAILADMLRNKLAHILNLLSVRIEYIAGCTVR